MYSAKAWEFDIPTTFSRRGRSDWPSITANDACGTLSEGEWELAHIAQKACGPCTGPIPTAVPWAGRRLSPSPHTCAACAELMSRRSTTKIQLNLAQDRVCADGSKVNGSINPIPDSKSWNLHFTGKFHPFDPPNAPSRPSNHEVLGPVRAHSLTRK